MDKQLKVRKWATNALLPCLAGFYHAVLSTTECQQLMSWLYTITIRSPRSGDRKTTPKAEIATVASTPEAYSKHWRLDRMKVCYPSVCCRAIVRTIRNIAFRLHVSGNCFLQRNIPRPHSISRSYHPINSFTQILHITLSTNVLVQRHKRCPLAQLEVCMSVARHLLQLVV